MQEVEKIYTCEVTFITTHNDPADIVAQEQLSDAGRLTLERELKRRLNADKVDVIGYKCFIHEPKGGQNHE